MIYSEVQGLPLAQGRGFEDILVWFNRPKASAQMDTKALHDSLLRVFGLPADQRPL